MLAGLSDVAWAELEHAYGPATDVPDLIRALLSADPLTSLAIGYDEAWLPGPFPVASYRQRAVGGEQLLRAKPTDHEDDGGGYFQCWESLDEQQQDQMFAHIELAVYDAVRAGVPLYCALLADEDPQMR